MNEVQRRLAAILAADVVSYSAQIGTDEPARIAGFLGTIRGERRHGSRRLCRHELTEASHREMAN